MRMFIKSCYYKYIGVNVTDERKLNVRPVKSQIGSLGSIVPKKTKYSEIKRIDLPEKAKERLRLKL